MASTNTSLPAQPSISHYRASPWLYPILGINYFARHRFLWPLMRSRLLPCLLLSALVYSTLFITAYLPQVAFLAIFHSKGAWLNATILVLGESAAVTALLFEAFFVDRVQADVFDSVLVNEGHAELVSTLRNVEPASSDAGPLQRLGKSQKNSTYSPFSFRQIVEFILLLPLNFVPWIGVPLFLWLTGYRAGPLQHYRYFALRQLAKKERNAFIRERRTSYTSFGACALVLQLVPVLSMPFLMTTAAGSALWAARLENQRRAASASEVEGEDQPPPYQDEEV